MQTSSHIIEDQQKIEVEPHRLESGTWCHNSQRQIGEGDISASYSADRIGMGNSVRKPFQHGGANWVCVGKCGDEARAFRLIHSSQFHGEPKTYSEMTRKPRPALGFYHGMAVKRGREGMVLVGPEVTFVRGEEFQGSLF